MHRCDKDPFCNLPRQLDRGATGCSMWFGGLKGTRLISGANLYRLSLILNITHTHDILSFRFNLCSSHPPDTLEGSRPFADTSGLTRSSEDASAGCNSGAFWLQSCQFLQMYL